MRQRAFTALIILGLLAGLAFFNTRAREVAAQGPQRSTNVKHWGDAAELATKNAGKSATLTFAIDGDEIGDVTFAFYAEDAPNTVENFIQLATDGFYDGLIFHRVIKGFMIQGGDPTGTGTGDPGWKIPAEFNAQKHVLGTVAMARSQDPDSAGCQFYICHGSPSFLDGKYTVFGQVSAGQEFVDRFATEQTGAQDRPRKKLSIVKVVINNAQ